MGQAPIHLHREQVAAMDDMGSLCDAVSFKRDPALTYFSVPAEYLGRVVVGCEYEPAEPARKTSAHAYVTTGDPGDPGCDAECVVAEVWFGGRNIHQALTDLTLECMAAAVLAGKGILQ